MIYRSVEANVDANKKAITDARAKLKVAHDALKTARKDAQMIVKGLKGDSESDGEKKED